jgi:hypothetical protein
MKRAVSAALVAATAVVAAGCGGARTPESVALNQARESGGTQAQAVRAERWRLANGDPVDVVLVRARFCGTRNGYTAPKIHGRCLPQIVYFATEVGRKGGFQSFLQHGAAHLTAHARKAQPLLHIFPDFPGLLVRCTIPRRVGGTVAGVCESQVTGDHEVSFLEHWPLSQPEGHRNTAGWIVTLDARDHVVGVRSTGATPPQASGL